MAVDQKGGDGVILGCGYVGCAVARQWLTEGRRVFGVSRNKEILASIENPNFVGVVAEVDSDLWHTKVPREPEIALNCVSSAGGGIEGYRKSYIGGNESLAKWARSAQPGRILYTSSTTVYPFSDGREVREEDAGGDLPESGQILLDSEEVLLGDSALADRSVVLRLAGIYGPTRHYLLDSLRSGATVLPGRGDYYLNLIYLDDIVSAVVRFASDEGVCGKAFNISDGNPSTKEEVASWIAETLGLPPPVFDPNAVGGRRMTVNRAGGPPNRRVRIDKALAESSWKPSFPGFRKGYEEILRSGT
ncbi:MAG: NAD-dependent epimerase/dehydratase family protein [Verrucomicrobiota bacterium]